MTENGQIVQYEALKDSGESKCELVTDSAQSVNCYVLTYSKETVQ